MTAEHHPSFGASTTDFVAYLAERRPSMWWLEEVPGFLTKVPKLSCSPFELVTDEAQDLGYYVEALELDHAIWINATWVRVFVIGRHRSAGGRQGVRYVAMLIEQACRFVAEQPRTNVFDIVKPKSAEEDDRRRQSKEMHASK